MYVVAAAATSGAANWASQQAGTDVAFSPSQLLAIWGQIGTTSFAGAPGLGLELPANVIGPADAAAAVQVIAEEGTTRSAAEEDQRETSRTGHTDCLAEMEGTLNAARRGSPGARGSWA